MAPPPVTPSPHRFLQSKPRKPATQLPTPLSNTHQFNSAPRFSFASSQRVTDIISQDAGAVSSVTRSAPSSHRPSMRPDIIEDPSDEYDETIQDSIETADVFETAQSAFEGYDDYEHDQRKSKRRRITSFSSGDNQKHHLEHNLQGDNEGNYESDGSIGTSSQSDHHDFEVLPLSSIPDLSSPPQPAAHRVRQSVNTPRFILASTPAPIVPSTSAPTTFLKPPRFRPPDEKEADQKVIEPLPDAFSPHRRGQKYLTGGLAAQLRGWIMGLEISNTSMAGKEDPGIVKLLIEEVRGGPGAGMTFISGRQVHRASHARHEEFVDNVGRVKMILGGEVSASVDVQKGAPAQVGKMVEVKGPVWEVFIEGVRWGVGVNWEVVK